MRLLGKVIGRGTGALGASRAAATSSRSSDRSGAASACGIAAERVALVAGGVGSAALLLLARELASLAPFDVFYGGRGRLDLPRRGPVRAARRAVGRRAASSPPKTAAPGAAGSSPSRWPRGSRPASYGYLYACGPMGLLARLAALAAEHGVAGEAALETPMGCGFGACLGCAVPHVDGHFALCCKDGPVFRFDEVVW